MLGKRKLSLGLDRMFLKKIIKYNYFILKNLFLNI